MYCIENDKGRQTHTVKFTGDFLAPENQCENAGLDWALWKIEKAAASGNEEIKLDLLGISESGSSTGISSDLIAEIVTHATILRRSGNRVKVFLRNGGTTAEIMETVGAIRELEFSGTEIIRVKTRTE